jgi:hypothetical protein
MSMLTAKVKIENFIEKMTKIEIFAVDEICTSKES